MENIDLLWLVGSLAFLGGGLCGAILYHIFVRGLNTAAVKLAEQLDELQREFMDYKEKVADHFTLYSPPVINKMTETYKDVHEHMASGAESLCQDEQIKSQMGDLRYWAVMHCCQARYSKEERLALRRLNSRKIMRPRTSRKIRAHWQKILG